MSWDGIHQSDPRLCGSCFHCHSCHVCCHELSRTCFHGHHFYRNHRRGSWNHVGCRQPCKERNDPWISKKNVLEFVFENGMFHLVSSLTQHLSSIWHEEEKLRNSLPHNHSCHIAPCCAVHSGCSGVQHGCCGPHDDRCGERLNVQNHASQPHNPPKMKSGGMGL